MFITGLVTSVHCVAMCGPLVATYAVREGSAGSWDRRLLPHVAYQGSKIAGYVTVGAVLGLLGSALDLGGARGYVTIAAGVFMVLLGLNMTGRFPALTFLTLKPPAFLSKQIASKRRAALSREASGRFALATPVVLGLATVFMPCGPLQAAQLFAAGTGSPVRGAVAMLGFSLGTMPLMLGFGAVSGMLGQAFKRRMFAAVAVVVVLLGVITLNRGAMLVGSPVTLSSAATSVREWVAPSTSPAAKNGADGVTEVSLTIRDVKFQPSTLHVPAGRKVRLVVDRQEGDACSAQLAVPQMGVLADLAPNAKTVVELPAAKSGTYTLTCGMGMMSGSMVVGAGTSGTNAARRGLVGFVLFAVVAVWVTARRRKSSIARGDNPRADHAERTRLAVGFTAAELVLVGLALLAALVAGLLAGGYLSL